MVRLNRIDTEKYRLMQENKTRERQAKKILSELGIQTATNPVSSPYSTDWKFDDGTDNPEDFRGKPVFGVEEGGQTFFEFPFVQKENVKDLFIAQDLKDDGGGWKYWDADTKRRYREAEIIKGIEEGTILPDEAKRLLGEDRANEIINQFKEDQERKNKLKIRT